MPRSAAVIDPDERCEVHDVLASDSDSAGVELTAAQRARVDALLDTLLERPENQWVDALRRLCVDDAAVADEVASLLDAAAAVGSFMSRPASPSLLAPGPDDEPTESGQRIGAWRIVREIGFGGMGEVFEAERVEGGFTQRAALKLLRREAREQLERFQAERQILARLDHPGIARLLDGGIAPDGRPYMAMDFVEGRSITAHCAATNAPLAMRLALFLQVCDAVAYAHHHLVVHRDLKPANILVNADGQVRLLDFGIAKLLDDEDEAGTLTQAAPHTPLYAAPEQLTGGSITTATDVYALGLLLFELLTGEPPWAEAGTPVARMLRVVHADAAPAPSARAATMAAPPVPSRLLRGDLDAIVAKALRAEATQRYATVDGLKRDLEHAERGEPILAREGARLYTIGRVVKRYRWAAVSIAAVVLALSVGLGAAAWQAHRAAVERDIALRDAAREEALRDQLTGLFRSAMADHGSEAPTAKSMLDKSAQRILHEYRDQPQLAGQVVLTLADLYNALEDVQGSSTLLEGFLGEAGTNADPAAVADARQKLAGLELLRGHVERGGQLLDQAEAYWATDPRLHTEERLEEMGIRARWQRARNDFTGAIATQRAAIAARTAFSGRDHRETATLYNSLAITLATTNRLDEALQAYRDTSEIYDHLGLGDSLDAQIIRANTGTLAFRTGRLGEAETLLRTAIDRERAVAGDSAAVAASMGYYGRLLSLTDRPAEAIATLRSAIDIGTRYAGAASPLVSQARLFLSEAELASGDRAATAAMLTPLCDEIRGREKPTHPLTLRCDLDAASLDAAEARPAAAATRLQALVTALRPMGPAASGALAQALATLGEVQMAEHDSKAAATSFREAVALRTSGWSGNWELAVARERLGEALAASGDAAGAKPLETQAEDALQSGLGPRHPETLRAQRALQHLPT